MTCQTCGRPRDDHGTECGALQEIESLRKRLSRLTTERDEALGALAALIEVQDHDPGQAWWNIDTHEKVSWAAWSEARRLVAGTSGTNEVTP